jgi:hypothetical protein
MKNAMILTPQAIYTGNYFLPQLATLIMTKGAAAGWP